MPDEPFGDRPDQDLAAAGRLLESLRRVDRVTRDERRRLVAGHDLAGVDPDPDPQLGHLTRPGTRSAARRPLHVERGPHRAQRVVLVGARQAEHRHHRVADELLHRAAVPSTAVRISSYHEPMQLAQRLGIEPLAERGRIGQVAEEDADRLPRAAAETMCAV